MSEDANRMIQYLEAAKDAISQQQKAADEVKAQEELEEKREKSLTQAQEAVEQSIEMTVKNRRQEIEKHYDRQLDTIQSTRKKTLEKREHAKNRKMKTRVKDETAQLREENRSLKTEIRTLFQKEKIPLFCDSGIFYALYYPRRFREILLFLFCLLLTLGAIPCGLYLLFFAGKGARYLAVIYIVDVLVFGGLYILVNNRTKVHHDPALREGKQIRGQIADNEKQIRAATKKIQKDTNESMYDLGEFDDRLEELEQQTSEILNEKKQTLEDFERETKEKIGREIRANNEKQLLQLEEDCREAEEHLEKLRKEEQYWSRKMAERFGAELGTEFMEPEKLDLLILAFRNGAANMSEAQDQVRKGQVGK